VQILRVPAGQFVVSIKVSEPETLYDYSQTDLSDNSYFLSQAVSDENSFVELTLPEKYDTDYLITIDGNENEISVIRPYVDPNSFASTASEISEYSKHEEIARAIIDSIVDEGFYYKKQVIETTGNGSDFIPLWVNAKKILRLYENNELLYDAESTEVSELVYKITDDKTAIELDYSERVNRLESAPLMFLSAGGDLLDAKYSYRGFPKTFDYKLVLEVGYRNVPSDIQKAAEMLIEDLSCGRLDYYKRYVSDYNTEQYKIKFDKGVFEGTGNIVVDKILSKYVKSIRSLGVL
jgi:hypothetical protein